MQMSRRETDSLEGGECKQCRRVEGWMNADRCAPSVHQYIFVCGVRVSHCGGNKHKLLHSKISYNCDTLVSGT